MQIPQEIINFMEEEGTSILLIKGRPGVGKTILALSILVALDEFKGIFFSTRDVMKSILSQIPWISELTSKCRFIDALTTDMHLLSRNYIQEAAIELTTLPQFLKSLYLEILDAKRTTENVVVIIDSIDALSVALDLPKMSIIKQIKHLILSNNVKAVITVETDSVSELDYIADGVILLKKDYYGKDRVFRILEFEKMRGLQIKNPKYAFTLEMGKFYCFQEGYIDWRAYKNIAKHKVVEDTIDSVANVQFLSSGSKHFDKIANGFKNGSCILFSYSKDIISFVYGALTSMFAENFLCKDKHVFLMPKKSNKSKFTYDLFMRLVEEEKVKKYLHVFSLFDAPVNIAVGSKSLNTFEDFEIFVISLIEKHYLKSTDGVLVILDADHIFSYFDITPKAFVRFITKLITTFRDTNSLLLIKTFHEDDLLKTLEGTADYSFCIFSFGDQYFLYGVKPCTPIYNISLKFVEDHPSTQFKLVV